MPHHTPENFFEAEEIRIDQQQIQKNGRPFPLVLSPTSSSQVNDSKNLSAAITDWIATKRDDLEKKCAQHGAILFRGFQISNAEEFLHFTDAFKWKYGSYTGGGGPRNVVKGLFALFFSQENCEAKV